MNSKKRTGQGLVEMAFILPIFIFVLLGIIDFGRALHCWSTLNYQCVQAARVATKRKYQLIARNLFTETSHTTKDKVVEAFWNARSPMMVQSEYSDSSPEITGVGEGTPEVTVTAVYNLELFTPAASVIVGGEAGSGKLALKAQALERKE